MGEARRREEIKAREDKAFKIFEHYIIAIITNYNSPHVEDTLSLDIMRDKMRKLVNKGEINETDDGK